MPKGAETGEIFLDGGVPLRSNDAAIARGRPKLARRGKADARRKVAENSLKDSMTETSKWTVYQGRPRIIYWRKQ